MKTNSYSIKKTRILTQFLVFIALLLICIPNAFSQLKISAETPIGGLEIGSHDGIFKYTAVNDTDSAIFISSVHFNHFRGVHILQYPAAKYSINSNTSNTYLAGNEFNTPVTLNPRDTLTFSYYASAGCESIFELAASVLRQRHNRK